VHVKIASDIVCAVKNAASAADSGLMKPSPYSPAQTMQPTEPTYLPSQTPFYPGAASGMDAGHAPATGLFPGQAAAVASSLSRGIRAPIYKLSHDLSYDYLEVTIQQVNHT